MEAKGDLNRLHGTFVNELGVGLEYRVCSQSVIHEFVDRFEISNRYKYK